MKRGELATWVLGTVLLAACGAPLLQLQPIVRADAQLASQLGFVELTVLVQPAACADVAATPLFLQQDLDVVATATLEPSQAQTFTALASGRYVLMAEGFSADGTRIARGCLETNVGEKREVARATITLLPL